MDILFTLTGIGALGFIGWLVHMKMTQPKVIPNAEGSYEVAEVEAQRPTDKTDRILAALLQFNITLRDSVSNAEVVESTERVIDLVKELIEPVNRVHISEMTPVVNRMVEKYLPSLIIPFMKLTDEQQAQNVSTLLEKLGKLEAELNKVKDALKTQNTAAFDKQAEFISAMFTGADDNL